MSTERLEVVVVGKDQLSAVLQKSGASANRLASGLEQAGSRGARGLQAITRGSTEANRALDAIERNTAETVRALDRLDQSGQKTQRSFDGMKRGSAALGATAASLAGVLSDASRAAAEESAVFARLETQVEANGDSFDAYATRVDEAVAAGERLAFADDQVAAGLANLAQTTGSTEKAMANIGLAMDLARAKGISLADASTIIGKVAAGNTSILQRYGIAVAEGASSTEALAQVQARVAGQSTAFAESSAGALQKWQNAADNAFESLGAMTGPLQTTLAILPGLSAGYTLVGGALGGMTKSAKAAQLGLAGLSLATGPVGLVAAGTAAVGALGLLIARHYDQETATEAATRSVNDLTVALQEMQAAGADASVIAAGTAMQAQWEGVSAAIAQAEADRRRVAGDASASGLATGGLVDPGIQQQIADLDRYAASAAEVAEVGRDVATVLSYQGDNLANVHAAYQEAIFDFNMGRIGADAFAARLAYLSDHLNTYGVILQDTASSLAGQTQAQERVTAAQQRGAEMLGALGNAYGEATAANEQMVADLQAEEEAARELAATFQSALIPGIEGASAALMGIAGPGDEALNVLNDLSIQMKQVAGAGELIDQLRAGILSRPLLNAAALEDSAEILDHVLSQFETIDAMAQRVSTSYSIAEAVVGQPGEWGVVDDLLQRGRISLDEYYAAAGAGTGILMTNSEIETSLNTIRAKQLPTLGAAQAIYQDQIRSISELAPQQQALALAYLDTANQQKLMELSSLAAAAAAGELGTNGVEAANNIAQAALNADPALKALALDAGLATEDREGNITLNIGGADEAITNLTLAINDLTRTLGGVPTSIDIETSIEALPDTIIPPGYEAEKVAVGVKVGDVDLTIPPGLAIDPFKAPVEIGDVDLSIPAGLALDPLKAPVVLDVPSTTELAAMLPPSPPPIEAKVRIVGDNGQLIDVLAQSQLATDDLGNKVTTTYLTGDNGQLVSVVYDSEGRLLTIGGMAVTPQMLADNSILVTQYDASMGLLSILDGSTGLVLFQGDATGAINAGGSAAAARDNVDGTGATIFIRGDNSGVYAAANEVSGRTLGTSYINIVGIRSGFREFAHGGTVWPEQAAHGRTVMVGEAGPELVTLPGGSQVMPHGASMSMLQNSTMMRTMRGFSDSVEDLEGVADDLAHAVRELAVDDLSRVLRDLAAALPRETATGTAAGVGTQGVLADTSWLTRNNGPIVTTGDFDAITKYFQFLPESGMDWMNDFLTHISDWVSPGQGGEIYRVTQAIGRDVANGVYEGIQNYSHLASQATLDMVLGAKRAAEQSLGAAGYAHGGTAAAASPPDIRYGLTLAQRKANTGLTDAQALDLYWTAVAESGDTMNDWLAYMSPGTRASLGFAHGGTSWGNTHLVGEYGMELLKLPPGAQVTPHGASMSKLESDRERGRGRSGAGGNNNFYGSVNLYPAGQNAYDAIRTAALTRARYGG